MSKFKDIDNTRYVISRVFADDKTTADTDATICSRR